MVLVFFCKGVVEKGKKGGGGLCYKGGGRGKGGGGSGREKMNDTQMVCMNE